MSQEHKCASQICSPPTVKVCLCIPVRWNVQRVVSSQHSCITGCWRTKKIRIRKMFNNVGSILQQKQIDFVWGVQFSVYNWKMFWQQFNSSRSPLKQTGYPVIYNHYILLLSLCDKEMLVLYINSMNKNKFYLGIKGLTK